MRIEADEERVVVISDLHLGNPYSLASRNLRNFVDYLLDHRFSLVINGDGVDILQGRFSPLATQTLEVVALLRRLAEASQRIYYVVGNHDTALEHVLNTWLGDYLTPFLNLRSGGLRIRVEHGHIYDPFYVANPTLYDLAGAMVAPLLRIYPDAYRVASSAAQFRTRMRKRAGKVADLESPEQRAAAMIANRGFDVVIFGHTHRPEVVDLPSGGRYLNAGNWLRDSTFVQIADGEVGLFGWERDRAVRLG